MFRQGYSDDEVAAMVESDPNDREIVEGGLLDALAGEAMKTERYLRGLEAGLERDATDDEDDTDTDSDNGE